MVCVKLFQAVVCSLGDNPWLLNLGHHPALPRSLLPVFIGWCFQLSDWQEKKDRKKPEAALLMTAQYYSILFRTVILHGAFVIRDDSL